MSEYDILLKPTKLSEEWHEVPRITTCGKDKEIVKTWEDVIKCGECFNYNPLTNGTLLSKRYGKNTLVTFTKEGKLFINEAHLKDLDFNKMVLFILFLENKL